MAKSRKSKTNQDYIYHSKLKLPKLDASRIKRANLEFYDIDPFGTSYEGRIFLNNSKATENTQKTSKNGYVGSFHIFGHGGMCLGGKGHCSPPTTKQDAYDMRTEHMMSPVFKSVTITESLKKILKSNKGKDVDVTIVPIFIDEDETGMKNIFRFKKLNLMIYDK